MSPISSHDADSDHPAPETAALLSTPDPERAAVEHVDAVASSAQLTLFNAFALLVGSQIGSGIFSSAASIDQNVSSPASAILIWFLGGLLAWSGAASYAELGTAIAKNGGTQEYLHYIYGDFLASVMGWVWIIAVKPSSMAIQSIIFAEYWISAIVGMEKIWWAEKCLAFVVVVVIWVINSASAHTATKFTDAFLFVKLAGIAAVLVLAFLAIVIYIIGDPKAPPADWRNKSWFDNHHGQQDPWPAWEALGHYTAALYACMWAYSGWDHVNFVAGEMKNPQRDLPRAIHSAVPTVVVCFVLTNIAYYIVVPWKDVGQTDAIAVAAGQRIFGTTGGVIMAILVSGSCLGSVNINIFTTGKLTVAAAQHGYFPRFLVNMESEETIPRVPFFLHWAPKIFGDHVFQNTPIVAMAFNAMCTCVFITVGTFNSLITFIGLAEYTFAFLTVAGLLRLRRTQPKLLRPYKPPTLIPLVFTIIAGLLTLRGILFAPIQAALLVLLVGFGGLAHWNKSKGENAWKWPKLMAG